MKTFLTIWIKPKLTFEHLSEKSDKELNVKIILILFLISIGPSYKIGLGINKLNESNFIWSFIIALALIPLMLILFNNYVMTFILWGIGRLISGKARFKEIRIVLAYSLFPFVIHSIISTVIMIIALIKDDLEIINYENALVSIVLSILCLRIMIFGVSYFNKFNYSYSWINILLFISLIGLLKMII